MKFAENKKVTDQLLVCHNQLMLIFYLFFYVVVAEPDPYHTFWEQSLSVSKISPEQLGGF